MGLEQKEHFLNTTGKVYPSLHLRSQQSTVSFPGRGLKWREEQKLSCQCGLSEDALGVCPVRTPADWPDADSVCCLTSGWPLLWSEMPLACCMAKRMPSSLSKKVILVLFTARYFNVLCQEFFIPSVMHSTQLGDVLALPQALSLPASALGKRILAGHHVSLLFSLVRRH